MDGVVVVHAAHAAQVDELDRVVDLEHVVGLEVAVQQVLLVEVAERRQGLVDVGESTVDRQRVVPPAVGRHPLLEQLLERAATHVLHDDVATALHG